jgi:hypothetical protein
MSNRNKRPQIKGPYVVHTSRMLNSPAFRALSLTGHRILARIEIELCRHAGKDNSNLIVTYDDFERFGIDRHAIGPGLRELEALGFIEIVQRGSGGNADHRRPHMFRLTYQPTNDEPPTDEWEQIKTVKEAEEIATQARITAVNTPNPQWGKTPKPVGVSPTEKPRISVGVSPTANPKSPVGKSTTTF